MSGKVRFVDSNITISPGAGGTAHAAISSSYALSASYADYALSASHEIVKEVSSSYADTASYAITASYALNGGAGGGSGIFTETGSFYSTTNNLQVTGSLKTTQPIDTSGYVYVKHNGAAVSGGTAALFLGTTHQGMDLVRLNDSSLVLGGVTQNYGWRIFGIKHGLNGTTYTTEIDNLIATGSMNVSGSMDISLQSGSAFTITENDIDQQNRLTFGYDQGDPTLSIAGRAAESSLHLKFNLTGDGLKITNQGIFRRTVSGVNYGFVLSSGSLQPATTNQLDLGFWNRRWKNLYLYTNNKLSWGTVNDTDNVALVNPTGTNTLQFTGSSDVLLDVKGQISASGDLETTNITASGDILVGQYIKHKGNETTFINFTDNQIRFKAGDIGFFDMEKDASVPYPATINPGGNRINFRVVDRNTDLLLKTDSEAFKVNLYHAGNQKLETTPEGINITGNITASGDISASGDLYVRDGRFQRSPSHAEVEVIGTTGYGLVGTHTNDNFVLRRFNIPKLTISESRTFSHQKLDVQGQVSASTNLFAKQLYVEDQLAVDYSDGITIGNATDPIRLINDVTASGNISGSSVSTASFGTYLGDGSQLTGIETDPFPFSGSAVITGSLLVSGSGLRVTGSFLNFHSIDGDGFEVITETSGAQVLQAIILNNDDFKIGASHRNLQLYSSNQTASLEGKVVSIKAPGGENINIGHNSLPFPFPIANTNIGNGDRSRLNVDVESSNITGSLNITGSAIISGSLSISGSLLNTGTVSINDTNSPYTLTGTQQFVLIDPSGGDVTVNMPDAATYPGREIKFKLTQAAAANTVTLQRQGSDTIDGATTYTDLDIQYESISTVSNGSTGWFIF